MELSEKVTSLNNDDLILLLTVLKAKPGTENEIYFAKRKRQIPVRRPRTPKRQRG